MNQRIGEYIDILEGNEHPSKDGVHAEQTKPFLGIQFNCCGVYGRAYQNRAGTGYEARCPKCLRRITFQVGEGGTDARFFTVR